MRNFRYPIALPPLGTPVTVDGSPLHPEWQRWFESLQVVMGGQGQDALYDASVIAAVQASENAAAIQELDEVTRAQLALVQDPASEMQQLVEGVRAQVAAALDEARAEIATTLSGLGELARTDAIVDSNVADTAAIANKKIAYPTGVDTLGSDHVSTFSTEEIVLEVQISQVGNPALLFLDTSHIGISSGTVATGLGTWEWNIYLAQTQGDLHTNLNSVIIQTGEINTNASGVLNDGSSTVEVQSLWGYSGSDLDDYWLSLSFLRTAGTATLTVASADARLEYVGAADVTQ